ncbi:FCD domain-containing protein [Pelagibius sp.]|uniref:FCD domain-containing protein n=1 Tax=Pelagibius sp. TaxID=1931238 RepID=UPI002619B661|nr:FCD domain-containing protein [Pelagibius sp.]
MNDDALGRLGDGGSLTNRVQAAIEEMIMNGELRGGDKVNEITLSERFGTSRGPLREACRALAQEGLLVAIPNRGVFVRELDLREALEVYDVRSALDELMGRLIAERVDDAQVRELYGLVDAMDRAAAERDLERYYPTNLEFHNRLLALANNRRLQRLYKGLVKELHLFRRKGLLQLGSMRISNEEHRQIVQSIEARDPIAAGVCMKSHVLAAKQRLLAAVEAERAQEITLAQTSAPRRRRQGT